MLLESYNGTINATQSAAVQCPQLQSNVMADLPSEIAQDVLEYGLAILPAANAPQDEDCTSFISRMPAEMGSAHCRGWIGLTINVQVPSDAKPGDKLPVIAVSSKTLTR